MWPIFIYQLKLKGASSLRNPLGPWAPSPPTSNFNFDFSSLNEHARCVDFLSMCSILQDNKHMPSTSPKTVHHSLHAAKIMVPHTKAHNSREPHNCWVQRMLLKSPQVKGVLYSLLSRCHMCKVKARENNHYNLPFFKHLMAILLAKDKTKMEIFILRKCAHTMLGQIG